MDKRPKTNTQQVVWCVFTRYLGLFCEGAGDSAQSSPLSQEADYARPFPTAAALAFFEALSSLVESVFAELQWH